MNVMMAIPKHDMPRRVHDNIVYSQGVLSKVRWGVGDVLADLRPYSDLALREPWVQSNRGERSLCRGRRMVFP